MGVVIGVMVGYVLGARSGDRGWAEIEEAWKVISTSEEVRDLLAGGVSVVRDLLGRGSELLAGALSTSRDGASLRRIA